MAEVCERLGVEPRALAKLVDQVAFVGTPDGTPDELVDLYIEGDRLHVALPQQFTRAPRFSPDGKRLLSVSRDGDGRLWNVEGGDDTMTGWC